MTRRRATKHRRQLGFEWLEVRRLLTGHDTIATAIPETLTLGVPTGPISGNIDDANIADLYQVDLVIGQHLTANVDVQSLGSGLVSRVRVFNDAGDEQNHSPDVSGDSSDSYAAVKTGTYYVGVSDLYNAAYDPTISGSGTGGFDTGAYNLTLLVTPPVSDPNGSISTATSISFVRSLPTSLPGAIAFPNDADLFKLSLNKRDDVQLSISRPNGSPLDSRLRLFDSSGTEIVSNHVPGSDPSLTYEATATGVYYVGVSGGDNASYDPHVAQSGVSASIGAFNLDVTVNSPPPVTQAAEPDSTFDDANSIALGTSVGGHIGGAADQDFFVFTLTATGQLTARATTDPLSSLASRLTLYGPDRQPMISADGQAGGPAATIQQHLPVGTYYLGVSTPASAGAAASGDYHLSTSFIDATPPFADIPAGAHPTAIAKPDRNSGLLLDQHGNPIIDFNGDGIPDLAVANEFSGDVSILLGVGDGTFHTVTPNPTPGGFLTAIAVGNFNPSQDSFEDIAVTDYFSGTVSVFLGDGHGMFTQVADPLGGQTLNGQPLGLAVGDFTGDGNLDLAVAVADFGTGAGNAIILKGAGDGTFSVDLVNRSFPVGVRPYAIVAARFGNDPFLDLAVVNRNSDASTGTSVALGPGSVSILRGNGDGTFQSAVDNPVGNQPTSIAVGNIDGDVRPDLAVANSETGDISLLFGNADGSFLPEQRVNLVGESTALNSGGNDSGIDGFRSTVMIADFNGDGRLDLGLANSLDPRVRVALQNANGTFGPAQAVVVGGLQGQPQDLLAVDFTGNGRLGIAGIDGFGGAVSIRLGLGDGTFQVPRQIDVGNQPNGLVAADFNHDGQLDMAVANNGAPGGASVLMGTGGGAFQQQAQFPTGISTAIASGDFNGDGRPDFATTNYDPDTGIGDLTVLLGLGDGTFYPAIHFATGDRPTALVIADFNGDGRPDIAVVNQFSHNVSVFLNKSVTTDKGAIRFADPVNYDVGTSPVAIAAGQFDDDQHLDLVVADAGSNNIWILSNDGHGGFLEPPLPVSVGNLTLGIVVGNFGNGRDDLAVLASGGSDVSILMNQGGGVFTAAANLTAGTQPSAIVVGDFNGDKVLDLAAANSLDDSISVFQGLGSGAFLAGVTYPVGHIPSALVAADLNGDGRIDLACANGFGRDVSILLNRGDGKFVPPDRFTAVEAGSTPTLADVTGDGLNDSIALDRAGQILVRPGRTTQPGAFDAARIANPDHPARDFAIVTSGGRQLIAAVDLNDDFVSLYATNVNGVSTLVGQLQTGDQPARIAVGDLTHSGRQDLVVANANSGNVSIFLATANGGFAAPVTIAVTDHPTELALIDLNDDPLPEIVVTDAIAGTVSVLVNQGGSSFAPAVHYRASTGQNGFELTAGLPNLLGRDGAGAMAWGNFSENGTIDLIVVNPGDASLSLLEGDGHGGFLSTGANGGPTRILAGVRPAIVRAGHFYPDGHLDLAVLDADHHTITILRGDGQGNFQAAAVQPDAGNLPDGLSIGNFDGDGKSDLIVGNQFGDVMSLVGHADGTFDSFTRIGQGIAIAVGDVTGNGRQSWLVTDQTRDQIVLKVGGTTTSFSQQRSDGVGATQLRSPGAAKLIDLNGDHILDMIVVNSGGNDVLVYKGLGNGLFDEPVSFYAGTDPVDVQVANVDGNKNHLPDVIVTNQGSNDVSILLNDVHSASDSAASWLRPGPRLNVGLAPVSAQLIAATQPGGLPSLLVTNSGSNNVFMLPALGGGFFNDAAPAIFNTGLLPQATIVGNFFGVGSALVTVNYLSNSLTVYRNFDPNSRRDIGSGGIGPIAAIAGDLAQNGALELVVGNSINGALAIFAGSVNGLVEADALFNEDLQHPVALALAAPGEGQELRLLAADEGDENVRVFSRETVLQPSKLADNDLTPPGMSGFSFGFSNFAVLLSALGVVVEAGVGDFISGIGSEANAGGASVKLPSLREWFESTVTSIVGSTKLHDVPDGAIEVLESVLDVAAPQLPWRVLHHIFQNWLHATNGNNKAPPKPNVIDQVFETGGDDDEFDFIDDPSVDPAQSSLPFDDLLFNDLALPKPDDGVPCGFATERSTCAGHLEQESFAPVERLIRQRLFELEASDSDHWLLSTMGASAGIRHANRAARRPHGRPELITQRERLARASAGSIEPQEKPLLYEDRWLPEVVAAALAGRFALAGYGASGNSNKNRRNRFASLGGVHGQRD